MDVRRGPRTPIHYLGCGYWSEDDNGWRTDGIALGALGVNPDTNIAVMQCATFHLSAFSSHEDSTTPQWNTADLFIDFRILAKVGEGKTYQSVAKYSADLEANANILG